MDEERVVLRRPATIAAAAEEAAEFRAPTVILT
jgi:hypothetical protein